MKEDTRELMEHIEEKSLEGLDYQDLEFLLNTKMVFNGYPVLYPGNEDNDYEDEYDISEEFVSRLSKCKDWTWDITMEDFAIIMENVSVRLDDEDDQFFSEFNYYIIIKYLHPDIASMSECNNIFKDRFEIDHKRTIEYYETHIPHYSDACVMYEEIIAKSGRRPMSFQELLMDRFKINIEGFPSYYKILGDNYKNHPNWNGGDMTTFEELYFNMLSQYFIGDTYSYHSSLYQPLSEDTDKK